MAKSVTAESDTEFDAPGTVSGFSYEEAMGHLLVVVPHKVEEGVKTAYGDTTAILADIHDITAKTTADEVLIFPKVLVIALSKRIGGKVLATLGQGVAKPGQSAPWVLQDQSTNPKAAAAAKAYLGTLKKKAEPVAEEAPAVQQWNSDDDGEEIPF